MSEKHPFEPGGRYRTRGGDYTVAAIHGDTMTVHFDDGRQQTLNIATQSRIWRNISIPTSSPRGPRMSFSTIWRCICATCSSVSSRASTTVSAHCEKNFTVSEFEMLLWVEICTSTPMRRA